MRKIILNVATSLDGMIEGPNGEYDWCFTDGDYGMEAFLKRTDSIFFGRKSYERFMSLSEEMWGDKKHYVFSNSLKNITKSATLVSGEIEPQVKAIKMKKGKDIWLFGGASLTASLVQAKLVDEILVAIHPIILGAGKPILQLNQRTPLLLLETIHYPSGIVQSRYAVQ